MYHFAPSVHNYKRVWVIVGGNCRDYPKINKLIKKVDTAVNSIISDIGSSKAKHPNWSEKDSIREKIDQLFKNKIGDACKDYDEVIKQGQQRYAKDIPPGYKDKDKSDDPSGTRKYGDWIGWYQIIEKVKKDKIPIILITSDQKEDWWLKIKEKIIGPRPELTKEILQHNVNFHMYTMESFLDYAIPKYRVKKNTIKEIEEVNKKIIETKDNLSLGISSNSGIESNTIPVTDDGASKQII